MPALAKHFEAPCNAACSLASSGENVRTNGGVAMRNEITVPRLEYLYEIAFLRIFVAWETFLEESFLRYMCGFSGRTGKPQVAVRGAYSPNLAHARATLHGTYDYLLWHSPKRVIARSKSIFVNGVHELVVASNQARVDYFANMRHRIAHGQLDAQQKFDAATMNLVGRRYPGSRVGRFLRDTDPGQALPTRWLDSIAAELSALALQVVPL
jgi:hypothetical protein